MKKIIIILSCICLLSACAVGWNASGGSNGVGTSIGIGTGIRF
ncbi:hypothetical protein [Conservatibacter flavescens]|uniref:Lipoprotein n=1 Tax=Conservatibacter flavescens TaxID=28161 RepID=A0A2M8S538_9PAST|nr:hypothetical protein [Conservatibacter flavescens]PJG86244.1 hypothetical protein CVP05_00015 [Conservatibacter flavescens]